MNLPLSICLSACLPVYHCLNLSACLPGCMYDSVVCVHAWLALRVPLCLSVCLCMCGLLYVHVCVRLYVYRMCVCIYMCVGSVWILFVDLRVCVYLCVCVWWCRVVLDVCYEYISLLVVQYVCVCMFICVSVCVIENMEMSGRGVWVIDLSSNLYLWGVKELVCVCLCVCMVSYL